MVRDIIKPMTAMTRCRFAELPEFRDIVGAAQARRRLLASTAPTTVQRSSPIPPSQPQSFGSHCWGAEWGLLVAALADGADPNRRVWIDVRRPVVANVVQRSSRAGASVAGSVGLAWCEADPAPFLFACRSLPCASGRAGPATRTRAARAVWVG